MSSNDHISTGDNCIDLRLYDSVREQTVMVKALNRATLLFYFFFKCFLFNVTFGSQYFDRSCVNLFRGVVWSFIRDSTHN